MKLERSGRVQKIVTICCTAILVMLVVFLTLVATRDLPEVNGEAIYEQEEKPLVLTGLSSGQAGIGSRSKIKAVYGGDRMAPIASLTKLVTSAVAMEQEDDLDKIITLDEVDVSFYEQAVIAGGSRMQIIAGEQLSLRQMHEALLIISANNIADSFVYHLFGNFESYKVAAEEWLNKNGLEYTRIGLDASGLDAGTVSSPSDMIRIGQIVLDNPEISKIVKMRATSFPLEGEVKNTNELLDEGYFGIKTGNTDEAGSCLLFVTQHEGQDIIGILMGQPFNSTFDTAKMLVEQVKASFSRVIIPAGTIVGKYDLPWGERSDIATVYDVDVSTWDDADIEIEIKPYRQNSYVKEVGVLKLGGKETSLELKSEIHGANIFWRVVNIGQLKW